MVLFIYAVKLSINGSNLTIINNFVHQNLYLDFLTAVMIFLNCCDFSAEISAQNFYAENTDPSVPCLLFDFEPLPLLYGLNRAIWRSGGSDQ
jgi:hypothetical protein